MIRINQIKLLPEESEAVLKKKAARKLKVSESQIESLSIARKSIDARKKDEIKVVYSVDVKVKNETNILKKNHDKNVVKHTLKSYDYIPSGTEKLNHRPVIIGAGPAGLFCTLYLAKAGYRPILLERGTNVDERTADVEKLWKNNCLNPESNPQFGEGGAGTFSDGKLNTAVHDKSGRNREVLQTFVSYGAPDNILYDSKPHIGTDILQKVIKNMRKDIQHFGGEVYFHAKVTDLLVQNGKLTGVEINSAKVISCDCAVLAIGHSARDTFQMLYNKRISMEPKAFAVGVRVQHPQKMINISQYGEKYADAFGAANYKVTAKTTDGRGVYSFCMCPGGYVVNASSEEKELAVNGMSYSKRDSENANSAIIVTVMPEDYGGGTLDGIAFQRDLEQKAYEEGKGKIPVQLYEDFCRNQTGSAIKSVRPCIRGQFSFGNIRKVLPDYICKDIIEGMEIFGTQIHGFDDPECILAAVESRTSSPVRILRNDEFTSISADGLYPCGEGAGYAGGITSAAIDGLKVYEAITSRFKADKPDCDS